MFNGYGVSDRIFDFIQYFLSNLEKSDILNGHYSRSLYINTGSPHFIILATTFFLSFINDLTGVVSSWLSINTYIYTYLNDKTDKFDKFIWKLI